MSVIHALSIDELNYIINCNKFVDVQRYFHGTDKIPKLQKLVTKLSRKPTSHKIFRSMLAVITDGPSYPLYIWAMIIGLISFGIIPITIITCGIVTLLLLTGSLYFYVSFKNYKKKEEKEEREQAFLLLKLHCTDEFIAKKKRQLDIHGKKIHYPSINLRLLNAPITQENKLEKLGERKYAAIKQSISTALIATAILFETYYLSTFAILTALGLTTIAAPMLGVIGISLAVIVITSISLFLAYKQYQLTMQEETRHCINKNLENEFEAKKNICNELTCVTSHIKKPRHENKKYVPIPVRPPRQGIKFTTSQHRLFATAHNHKHAHLTHHTHRASSVKFRNIYP